MRKYYSGLVLVRELNVIRYVPPFILHKYEANELHGTLRAYVLLVDIADFTTISTSLQQEGKQGAEELSRLLELAFGKPIELVKQFGGFVSIFAGDAFCAFFPEAEGTSIISVVNSITSYFAEKSIYKTSFRDFTIQVRQTICYGAVDWTIYPDTRQNEYVFSGDTILELAELSSCKAEVVFSEQAALSIGEVHFERLEIGYKLISDSIAEPIVPLEYHYTSETLVKFIHPKYREVKPQNEIRSAAYCFASLAKLEPEERGKAISIIQSLADRYGGFVNRYDATDKGLVALLLFGIPYNEGKTLERICSFSLEAVESIPGIALGISCGRVFAGFTGGNETSEYTAFGHPVNLAARLMYKARAGEVLTDTFLWQEMHARFDFDYLGSLNLKGIVQPIRYYHLKRFSRDQAWHQESRFVGRDEELITLRARIDSSIEKEENAVIYVSGDAGIGKSRLVKEALTAYQTDSCHKYFLTCDAILPKSLEAIKQIVRAHFYYNPQLPIEAGIAMFRGLWLPLTQGNSEMQRIESIIASLLGYEWHGSLWSVLPLEEKTEQLRNAFTLFIEQLSRTKPVLIHLDDGQWIDNESREYLQALSEKEIKPVVIVSTCRYLEDGNKVDLELSNYERCDIDLNSLTDSGSVELIKTILRLQNVPPETLSLITDRAMGNPLFIEQLASFLMETGSIDDKGLITGDVGYLSSFSISDIISSRIDRLTEQVRECMFNASVLGMEFNVRVLSEMLKSELKIELQTGVNNRIWKDLDTLRYIFTHILIKELLYQRMMTDKLQKLHQTAAEAMETVYVDKLDQHAEDIAFHYDIGGQALKAAKFYGKAGCYYKEKYELTHGEKNLQKALSIWESVCNTDCLDIAVVTENLALLRTMQGKFAKAEVLYLKALGIAEGILGKGHPETSDFIKNLAVNFHKQGKFDQAKPLLEEAYRLNLQSWGTDDIRTADCLKALGKLAYRQRNPELAEHYYRAALSCYSNLLGAEHPETAILIGELANLYRDSSKYVEAEKLYLNSLEVCTKALGSEHPDTTAIMNNLAGFFYIQGLYAKAEELWTHTLVIREKVLGTQHPGTAMALNNLVSLYCKLGDFTRQDTMFQRALEVSEQVLGFDHPELDRPLINLAHLYIYQDKLVQAEALLLRALSILENTSGVNRHRIYRIYECLIQLYTKSGDLSRVSAYQSQLENLVED